MGVWGAVGTAAVSAFVVIGCSGSTDAPPPDDQGNVVDESYCATEDDSPEWAMPLAVMGEEQTYKVSVVESTPVLPVTMDTGNNSWTVKVEDAGGHAVDDASIETLCLMPVHGHGCEAEIKSKALGDGRYELSPLIFRMTGSWTVSFEVARGDDKDVAVLHVCL